MGFWLYLQELGIPTNAKKNRVSDHWLGFSTTASSETGSGLDSRRDLFEHACCSESVVSVAALCFDGGGDEESALHSAGWGRVVVADGEEGCLSESG